MHSPRLAGAVNGQIGAVGEGSVNVLTYFLFGVRLLMTELEKIANKLHTDMLEAEISNVLPGTDEGEEVIRNRHLWLIEQALLGVWKKGAEAMRKADEAAIRSCPSLDENGYVCTKDATLKAISALPIPEVKS